MTQKKDEGIGSLFRSFLYAILIAVVFRSFAYEPFHIPSASMRGTLLEGDYIFVSKLSYGYGRYSFPFGLPKFEGRVLETAPKRGDVIVFRLPTNPRIDYIKRLVGLPGDVIRVADGVLYINDKAVPRTQVKDFEDMSNPNHIRAVKQYEETMPEGKKYLTLDETQIGEGDYTAPYTVPEKHYFFMGDNRDNSVDSRFINQVGFVPEENLVGRAEVILFSFDRTKGKWYEFWKWPQTMRDGRFFKKIS